uniref:Reverse transcriptase zinc-binding domain-containing protein n=1 Tax=Amblyomma maculatum TaxID=34609 RepID=G3MTV2_AMBMU
MPVRPSAKTFLFKLHSNTLPVKTWLNEKGIFVPWTTNCLLCKKPETIEHVFLQCWDAVFLWDVLQRTIKKELPLTPYGIRFLPVQNDDAPYDLIMLLGLHSLWKTRMQVRHADINTRSARENFIESAVYIRETFRMQQDPPQWQSLFD